MCKYFQTINKYVSENNFYDTLDFLENNQIKNLTFEKNKKIKLKYNNLLQGGDFTGINNFIVNSEYIANIDEYIDMVDKNKKYINFIKINAIKDIRGDYETKDHCAILIIDMKRKSASIQSLNNYKDCLKCKDGNEDYKISDTQELISQDINSGAHQRQNNVLSLGCILMRIILTLCRKEKVNEITLTDNSYFLCNNDNNKIPLKYLRTLTKGEPYYCKFGFRPKYEEDITTWKNNKKIFLEKPTITKKEFKKILMDRKFDENDKYDKKILYHINNFVLPKLEDENVISVIIKIMMECKTDISCDILKFLCERIYLKIYKEYKHKTFIMNFNK